MEQEKMENLIKKVEALRKDGAIDLSLEEDLSIAIMNLVSLEEHFFFTAEKTGKSHYLELLQQTREIRKSLLARMLPQNEGETWCISKHLLAASMRLIEVGTKYDSQNKKEDAQKVFSQAYQLYSLFWAIRLKVLSLQDVRKISDDQLNTRDTSKKKGAWEYKDIVNKLIDCCHE